MVDVLLLSFLFLGGTSLLSGTSLTNRNDCVDVHRLLLALSLSSLHRARTAWGTAAMQHHLGPTSRRCQRLIDIVGVRVLLRTPTPTRVAAHSSQKDIFQWELAIFHSWCFW
jgi:hypothetical protein